ncbi:hypothetical protein I0C86_27765 [Plantactinospora sp. S1510]|uniref:HTH cro/C1-type domain-containing protein n=1 Tax=Plantactinospora alkalitolerans TaxID=2789879 RepID=A0ABS0H2P7_9ACTN|nr:hypothetical protein [Plantactinospora alkalitolerans]MBF9132724.1 hypothetical protein [Plantactinospora alkalitolerans]
MSNSRLAVRVERLFDVIRPEGRNGRMYTNEEVAAAIRASQPSVRVGGAYLSAIRKGTKSNPSRELLVGLADFFGLRKISYFVDELTAEQVEAEITFARALGDSKPIGQVDAEATLAQALENHGVRMLAMRALALSPQRIAEVTKIVNDILNEDQSDDDDHGRAGEQDEADA